jgi:lipopolysaccharide exporter
MSLKQSAVTGVKWTTLSTGVSAVLQIGQLTVLARLLKPEDFGLMAMVMIIIGFAQAYADMGISAAVIHKQDVTRDQLSSLYWLNILTGIVVYLTLCVITPLIVMFFHEPRLYQLLPVVALSFLIASTGLQFLWLLEKELKFDLLAKQEIASTVAGAGVAIISAYLGHGVWSLVWGQLVTAACKAIFLIIIGWPRWTPHFHFKKEELRGFVSFGL